MLPIAGINANSRRWEAGRNICCESRKAVPMGDIPGEVCRILLVDDHKLLMEGVRSLLAPYGHLRVVGMAQNGGEAVALAASLQPHLLVLDLGMPGMNGLETGRAVLEVRPQTRILVYTGHEDQRWLPELIDLGIMGHVRKSESPGVLLRAIESVRAGEIYLSFPDPGGGVWRPCCVSGARLPIRQMPMPGLIWGRFRRGRKRFFVCWLTA